MTKNFTFDPWVYRNYFQPHFITVIIVFLVRPKKMAKIDFTGHTLNDGDSGSGSFKITYKVNMIIFFPKTKKQNKKLIGRVDLTPRVTGG